MAPTTAKKTTKKASKKTTKKAASKKTTKKVGKKAASKKRTTKRTTKAAAPSAGSAFHLHGIDLSPGTGKGKGGYSAEIPVASINVVKGFNPRGSVGDVEELAKSIKSEGLLQPLLVRPAKQQGKFDLIAGERRLTAIKGGKLLDRVPVLIRPDLTGDDPRSLAVAIAENSEDGRLNLNMVEIGRAAQRLQSKEGWTPARIAKETGLHPQRVRRALSLMEVPKDVQSRIEEGTLAVQTGLEVARLDPKLRKKVSVELDAASTAADVKKIRKQHEKSEATSAGKVAPTTKSGAPKKKVVTNWRTSTEKQEKLAQLCWYADQTDVADRGAEDFHNLCGAIASLLWDRGDREQVLPPAFAMSPDDAGYAANKKEVAAFEAVIQAEAAKYEPTEDDLDEEELEEELEEEELEEDES